MTPFSVYPASSKKNRFEEGTNSSKSVPLSVKVALGLGTLVGATIAVINNKEAIYETAEAFFTRGAEYCREKIEEAKIANETNFADHYQDEEFKDVSTGKSTGSNLRDESDYEDVSTPETSDFSEIDTDFQDDDDLSDEKEQADDFDTASLD